MQALGADDPRGFTIGAGVGDATVDMSRYDEASATTLDVEFELTPNIALSFGSRNFADFETEGLSSASLSFEGYEAGLVASARASDSLVMRAMAGYMTYKLVARALGQIGKENDGTATLGFGIQYELNRSFGIQANARRAFTVSDATIDWVTLSAYLRFVKR
jgi:hypothetical protein